MDINKIETICGPLPPNFKEVDSLPENFVFENDPNFSPINLYDFLGNGATVNSFTECVHYVQGGWDPSKITIFDIAVPSIYSLIGIYIIYHIYKSSFFKNFKIKSVLKKSISSLRKFENTISSVLKKSISSLRKFEKTKKFVFSLFFIVQTYFSFDYIRTKTVRIPSFIDEYISLTSNINFFKNLDFNAGEFLGGSYSVALTSGPISAVGSVIGWNFTNKIAIARISNFFWIYILQIIFILILKKVYKKDVKFLFYTNGLILFLIPWWEGSLYSLGEIPSLIIFINAIFLFPKLRYLSVFLFSLSIVYGKILNLVPFAGFYLIHMINEKKLTNIYKDLTVFFIPLTSWLLLAHFNYEKGNSIQYLKDQFSFIINHRSSGSNLDSGSIIFNFTNSINASEFSIWNNYDKLRLIFVPILFCIILYKNKDKIDLFFGKVTNSLIFSISFSYLWFWLLNDTKWIRYTQHFSVLLLIAIIYLINYKLIETRLDLIFLITVIALFIDNNKSLALYFILISIIIVYKTEKNIIYTLVKFLIVLIILIDISIPYFQKSTFGNLNNVIEECKIEIMSTECKSKYLSG